MMRDDIAKPLETSGQDQINRSPALLIGIIGLCCLIEGVLLAADWGFIPISRLRLLAYEFAGFWPGLLGSWAPNYGLQPVLMFFTYGFLHGGPWHLIVNMLTLWSLGRVVIERVGEQPFAIIYGLSILGGAIGFGLLAPSLRPMVGASGALFGLIGALLAWEFSGRERSRLGWLPVAQTVLALVLFNILLWWVMRNHLAWETHLGGFIAGWLVGQVVKPAPKIKPNDDRIE